MNTPAVIFFDGVCNFCNQSVQFVIRRDKRQYFRFAPLQSAYGEAMLRKHQLPVTELGTFLLWEEGRLFTRSTAALRVCRRLGGAWPILYAFIIVPAFLRNAVYDWVARNRYRWFGKRDTCMIPNAAQRALFITEQQPSTHA